MPVSVTGYRNELVSGLVFRCFCYKKSTLPICLMSDRANKFSFPFLSRLLIKNFRVLHDVEFNCLTPLTVLIGENGSGKTTVFEALSFLHDCFTLGLRETWYRYGGAKELRTLGQEGPITVEIEYKISGYYSITYHLSIDEENRRPVVIEEWVHGCQELGCSPLCFLEHNAGKVRVISSAESDNVSKYTEIKLNGVDLIATSVLGQFEGYPEIAAIRDIAMGWRIMPKTKKLKNINNLNFLNHSSASLDLISLYAENSSPDFSLPSLICIEEPAMSIYPRLLASLTERFRDAAAHTQFIITTHAPIFLNALRPEEVWLLYRNQNGYTQVRRVDFVPHVIDFWENGGLLGHLWTEGYLNI